MHPESPPQNQRESCHPGNSEGLRNSTLGTRGGGRDRHFLLFHRSFPSKLLMKVAKHTGNKSDVQDLAAAIRRWPLRPHGLPKRTRGAPGTQHITDAASAAGSASLAADGGRAGPVNSDGSLLATAGPAGDSGPGRRWPAAGSPASRCPHGPRP